MTTNPWPIWCAVLGLSLGGFFDGILLHQILGWHHLLSLVPGITDIGTQILWDGIFHLLMYVLVVFALVQLWRCRKSTSQRNPTLGWVLVGFGFWHMLDAILSHWLLGIHRIKPDSTVPLMWDLGWLVIFGAVPVFWGRILTRLPRPPARPALALGLLAVISGGSAIWSLQPSAERAYSAIIFAPWSSLEGREAALASLKQKVIWADLEGGVAIAALGPGESRALYRSGALMIGGAGFPEGCFGWSSPV